MLASPTVYYYCFSATIPVLDIARKDNIDQGTPSTQPLKPKCKILSRDAIMNMVRTTITVSLTSLLLVLTSIV